MSRDKSNETMYPYRNITEIVIIIRIVYVFLQGEFFPTNTPVYRIYV